MAEKKLLELLAKQPVVLAEPAPRLSIVAIEATGIKLELAVSLGANTDAGMARTALYREIWTSFKAEGLHFAAQQVAVGTQTKAKSTLA